MRISGPRLLPVSSLAFLLGLATLLSSSAAIAGPLKKGERELAFRASYSELNIGTTYGLSIGRQKNLDVSVTGGWLVTDGNEVGLSASYTRQETTGSSYVAPRTVDGTTIGVFYDYNFRIAGTVAPYVGAEVLAIGGDIGNVYDLQYSGEVGIKIYPWDHAGFALAADYSRLKSARHGPPDVMGLALSAAIAVKF